MAGEYGAWALTRLRKIVREAVAAFVNHGYDSEHTLEHWLREIQNAAVTAMLTPERTREYARNYLVNVYSKQVGGTAAPIRRAVGEIPTWTIDRLKPQLRTELERRIFSSASLIKLNQEDAVATTLRRFSGWASSIPAGGSDVVEKRAEGQHIVKPLAQLDFIARRTAIDQGRKMVSSINHVVALDSGAIAARWRDRGEHDKGYNARPDHLELSGKVMLIPDSWAVKEGLVKPNDGGWTTDHPMPGELVFCSCTYVYIRSLSKLPEDMLTVKGWTAVAAGRAAA